MAHDLPLSVMIPTVVVVLIYIFTVQTVSAQSNSTDTTAEYANSTTMVDITVTPESNSTDTTAEYANSTTMVDITVTPESNSTDTTAEYANSTTMVGTTVTPESSSHGTTAANVTDTTMAVSTITPERNFGENCTGVNCTSPFVCNTSEVCVCNVTSYYNSTSAICEEKQENGSFCSSPEECMAGLSCINNTCSCLESEYLNTNNKTDFCQLKQGNGSFCSSPEECMAGLSCINNTCSCLESEYLNTKNNTDFCQLKINYGESCAGKNSSDVCKEHLTACSNITEKCLCIDDYYRANSSECISRSNLKINVSAYRQTTYILFSWVDNSKNSNVNYTVSWNNGSAQAVDNEVNATLLDPGTQYTFLFTSTLPADSNYSSMVEVQNQTYWTRPASPGRVNATLKLSNTNISNTFVYEVTFCKSNGNTAYYKMVVLEGDNNITKTNVSSTMNFDLQPAHSYNYTITSFNDNSPKDESDSTNGMFRTDSEASGSVENLTSISYKDGATIIWQKPLDENGNITGYQVIVKEIDTKQCFYFLVCSSCDNRKPDTNCTVDGNATNHFNSSGYYLELHSLKPYHNYTVEVRAVNEKGLGTTKSLSLSTLIAAANAIKNISANSIKDVNTDNVSLSISWIAGDYTGPTTYYILVQPESGLNSKKYDAGNWNSVSGYSSTTVKINSVRAYWNYRINVTAYTDDGNGTELSEQFQTASSRPGFVQNLKVEQDTVFAQTLNITFNCPEETMRNGRITRFVLRQTLIGSNNNSVSENITDQNVINCQKGYSFTGVRDILVDRNYSYDVQTVNEGYVGEFLPVPFNLYTSPKKPNLTYIMNSLSVAHIVSSSGQNDEKTQITVKVNAKVLLDSRQGEVTFVGLVVCVVGQPCSSSGSRKRRDVDNYKNLTNTWNRAKVGDFKETYRPTPDNWKDTLSKGDESFVIGSNTSCADAPSSDYCNGPLPNGKQFLITVIVCTKAGCDEHKDDGVVFQTCACDESPPVGAIVGGVLGGLALIALICVIILLILRFRKHDKKRRGSSSTTSPSDYLISKEVKLKRPVKMRKFNDHVVLLHKDSNLLFQDEFESIQTLSKTFKNTCDEAKQEANRVKNRYVDILPYDQTRVKLDILSDGDETNDFINANYIPGYNSPREYIATQGPMYCTIPDFWRMIWEQKCKVIVMLSDLSEKGKRKVDLYWPENLGEPINYGPVVVEMTNFSQLNNYILRNFKVSRGEETRKMTHFFLPGWADFSADVSLDVVLGFVKSVRIESTSGNPGPIIVHCSAGVGRTGTMIALDYFTQYVEKHNLEDEIDIFDFVLLMRKHRCRMVQVESQYIFIYDAINKLVQQKIKAQEEKMNEHTSNNGLYANITQEENIYANGTVGTEKYGTVSTVNNEKYGTVSTVNNEKYVYNNLAYDPDPDLIRQKPLTEL